MMPIDLPIIVLTHEFAPTKGGIATFTEEMARAGSDLGKQIEVWAPICQSSDDSIFPFKVRRVPLKGTQDLSCQSRMALECFRDRKRLSNSIVYITDPGPILSLRALLALKLIQPSKLALTLHGSEINTFSSNPISRLCVRHVLKRANCISVPSSFSANLLAQKFPFAKGKTVFTHGGLRADFQKSVSSKNRDGKVFRILTVGRLHPRKGQDRLITALRYIPKELKSDLELGIVGSGNKHGFGDRLRALAESAEFRIIFYGDVTNDRLRELYAQSDLFAMTSIPYRNSIEGFGLVYLEAAAHGLPIIANRVGGVEDAVSDGENGILVDPGDEPSLTKALTRLIENGNLREKMGAKGLAWSRSFSWHNAFKTLFEYETMRCDSIELP
ncbi:MAG: glycosyltransferase family 4 protein [Opitutales bacterium]|nr:glycosyltransferase family 4 protein [Opitutales bacterium]